MIIETAGNQSRNRVHENQHYHFLFTCYYERCWSHLCCSYCAPPPTKDADLCFSRYDICFSTSSILKNMESVETQGLDLRIWQGVPTLRGRVDDV